MRWVRTVARLKSLKDKLLEQGWMPSTQMRSVLGVKRQALRKMHLAGRIEARICDDKGQWLYWPRPHPRNPTPTAAAKPRDRSGVKGAVWKTCVPG